MLLSHEFKKDLVTTHVTSRKNSDRRFFSGSNAYMQFKRAAGVETSICGCATGHPCSSCSIIVGDLSASTVLKN